MSPSLHRRDSRFPHAVGTRLLVVIGPLLASVVGAVIIGNGCGSPDCDDDVGCDSGVALSAPGLYSEATGPLLLTTCLNGACSDPAVVEVEDYFLVFPAEAANLDGPIVVTVRVAERVSGEMVLEDTFEGQVPVRDFRPNGPDCLPSCAQVEFEIDETGTLLPAA